MVENRCRKPAEELSDLVFIDRRRAVADRLRLTAVRVELLPEGTVALATISSLGARAIEDAAVLNLLGGALAGLVDLLDRLEGLGRLEGEDEHLAHQVVRHGRVV